MESKIKDNLAVIIFIVLMIIIGFFSTRFALNNISSKQTTTTNKKEDTGINQKSYDSIAKPSNYNSNISLESGFGRENPFAPYK